MPILEVLDFTASPAIVRTVVESERLSLGHLANPTFGAELAQIDPLPHQRLAVYQHLLPQTRLRFLLADDAEAGKTIMAGLYIREMLARWLIQRVLIVPPAGLVANWQRELQTLFNLEFTILELLQEKLDQEERDLFEDHTADNEPGGAGIENDELAEDRLLQSVIAESLADLDAERTRVAELLALARRDYGHS